MRIALLFLLHLSALLSDVNLDFAINNGRSVKEISRENVLTARGRKSKIMVFDGAGTSVQLPSTPDQVIVVNAGCTLIIKNKRLLGFRPEHVLLRNASTSKFFLDDGAVVDLEQNISLQNDFDVSGDAVINGNGKSITFVRDGSLSVFSRATLVIKDCLLKGLGDFKTTSGANATRLMCDENAHLGISSTRCMFDNTWSFTSGRVHFWGDVSMTSTWAAFKYISGSLSDVNPDSSLSFKGGMTFFYDSKAGPNKFSLVDESSSLLFDSASFETGRAGMNIRSGKIFVKGSTTFKLERALPAAGLTIAPLVDLTVLSGTYLKVAGLIAHGSSG
ncbi:hypothetical protein FJ366_02965 [Candidatus Dependentiae bacterium]|nr:hypothetical protein [Candidatus Dependentiae bacterium]